MAGLAVVLDANVLFGIEVTDVLLTLATKRLFRPHWSTEIHDEVRRKLITRPNLTSTAVDYRIAQMNRARPDALVDAPSALLDSMPVKLDSMPVNEKDRHVLALAVHVTAPIIVTNNLKDFPPAACDPLGIEAMPADTFLALQFDLDRQLVIDAFQEIAARRHRAPRTVVEILDRLEASLPATVGVVARGSSRMSSSRTFPISAMASAENAVARPRFRAAERLGYPSAMASEENAVARGERHTF